MKHLLSIADLERSDIERILEVAERDLGVEQVAHEPVQPAREMCAATVDSHERDLLVGVLLHDLVRYPHERTSEILAIEDCVTQGCVPLLGLAGPG